MDQTNQNQTNPSTSSGPTAIPTPAPSEVSQPATTPQAQTPSPAAPPSPGVDQPKSHKKPFLLLFIILIAVILLAGGAYYAMQLSQRTQRMGMYEPTPITNIESTIAEEQEIQTIDTGDPNTDILDIEADLNAIQ